MEWIFHHHLTSHCRAWSNRTEHHLNLSTLYSGTSLWWKPWTIFIQMCPLFGGGLVHESVSKEHNKCPLSEVLWEWWWEVAHLLSSMLSWWWCSYTVMTQHDSHEIVHVDMDVLCWSCVWEIKRACFIQTNILCDGMNLKWMILIVMATLHGTGLGPIFIASRCCPLRCSNTSCPICISTVCMKWKHWSRAEWVLWRGCLSCC